jgi:hypothetical protein
MDSRVGSDRSAVDNIFALLWAWTWRRHGTRRRFIIIALILRSTLFHTYHAP